MSHTPEEVLDAITEYFVRHGVYPTVRDLGERFGVSRTLICRYMQMMSDRFLVRMPGHRRRSYRLSRRYERIALRRRLAAIGGG